VILLVTKENMKSIMGEVLTSDILIKFIKWAPLMTFVQKL